MSAGGEITDGSSLVRSVARELGLFSDMKKNEDLDEFRAPFEALEKSSVLQNCRDFSDQKIVMRKPRVICERLTQLLYLIAQGEKFTSEECSETFFGVSKLFQSDDLTMRRLMYLFIKEVAEATSKEEVIIVTSSLFKDMNKDNELLRANSVRALCKIIDGSMLTNIDRYIKQAIVSHNPMVSCSALVSGHQLIGEHGDIVRRWANEVQVAVGSQDTMVQYHALSLLYKIRQHDRLAISKLVTRLWQSQSIRSPLALCMLIRYTSTLIRSNVEETVAHAAYHFLESCLRHGKEMVMFEAARAICNLPDVRPEDLTPAIVTLQMGLSSSKPAMRFAAVRTLNKVSATHPLSVMKCNDDMESLIADSNRSIATLAITTLLKTGGEASVDRLMKQISTFMGEISDEFKIVVVKSIRTLCLKFPKKHRILLAFLHSCLRDEGGQAFKGAIVETILDLMESLPEIKVECLNYLGEFIEDCEFPSLSVKVLHVLGDQAAGTPTPGRFIRFIYNRTMLELPHVRAAAVSSLAKIARSVDSLRPEILVLLRRCELDNDDEVRDRATMYTGLLTAEGEDASAGLALVKEGLPDGISVRALEKAVIAYQMRPTEGEMKISSLPIAVDASGSGEVGYESELVPSKAAIGVDESSDLAGGASGDAGGDGPSSGGAASASTNYAAEIYQIQEFANLGKLYKSTRPVQLTEDEVEYTVQCVKHIFPEHVVLQFDVRNTINDQVLKKVSVAVDLMEDDPWSVFATVEAEKVTYQTPGTCYVGIARDVGVEGEFDGIALDCELKFFVCDCDAQTGEELDPDDEGLDDEFAFDQVEIATSDFMARSPTSDFRKAWESMDEAGQIVDEFLLSKFADIPSAVAALVQLLGMQPCDGTASVPKSKPKWLLLLSGKFDAQHDVLARAWLMTSGSQPGVRLKLEVRCADDEISQLVLGCIS